MIRDCQDKFEYIQVISSEKFKVVYNNIIIAHFNQSNNLSDLLAISKCLPEKLIVDKNNECIIPENHTRTEIYNQKNGYVNKIQISSKIPFMVYIVELKQPITHSAMNFQIITDNIKLKEIHHTSIQSKSIKKIIIENDDFDFDIIDNRNDIIKKYNEIKIKTLLYTYKRSKYILLD